MHTLLAEARALSDVELIAGLTTLRGSERAVTARVVAHLAEVERRALHLALGYSSMFAYCQRALGYSEYQSYGRLEVARCARDYPVALDLLLEGALTMTAVGLLRPHLTPSNHREVLLAARGKTRSEVEVIVASLRPKPDVPASLRRLPDRAVPAPAPPSVSGAAASVGGTSEPTQGTLPTPLGAGSSALRPVSPATVAPLATERFRYQLTIDAGTRDLLARARELSKDDDAALLEKALSLLVAELERRKLGATERPAIHARPTGENARHVPAAVRRLVAARDGGQCAFVGIGGIRCTERLHLEFHHTDPWAAGGASSAGKVELRCRRHNQYEGRLFFERDASGAPRLARPPRVGATAP